MRTTLDLEADALMAAKELARLENVSLGKVVSRLIRQALTAEVAPAPPVADVAQSVTGFVPFASRGSLVSNDLIDRLRDDQGL